MFYPLVDAVSGYIIHHERNSIVYRPCFNNTMLLKRGYGLCRQSLPVVA